MELSRATNPIMHFDDDQGHPLVNGYVLVFSSKTSAPLAVTWKNDEGTFNTPAVKLDSRGECEIWLDSSEEYKFILKREDGSFVKECKGITASAHVPSVIPFVIDETHFKVTMLGNTAVLSLADSLIEKLREKGVDVE